MEITEKNRYLCRVQIKTTNGIELVPPWVEECNLMRDAYDRIQKKYGFRNDLTEQDDYNTTPGVRGVRLLNGELV